MLLRARMPIFFSWRALENLRAKVCLREENPVNREQNRVEVITVHGRKRCLRRVDGKSDIADLPFLFRRFHGLHGAAGAQHLIQIRHFGEARGTGRDRRGRS